MGDENNWKKTMYWFSSYLILIVLLIPSIFLCYAENRIWTYILIVVNFLILVVYFVLIFRRINRLSSDSKIREQSTIINIIYFLFFFYMVMNYFFAVIHYAIFRLNCEDYHVTNLTDYPFIDFFYFSVVTTTTLGYGDISPASALPKLLSIMQVIGGWLYIVFIIAITINMIPISRDNSSQHQSQKNKDA